MLRRDVILILVGAFSMHIFTSIIPLDHLSIAVTSHESFGTPPTDEILPSRFLAKILPHQIMNKVYTPPKINTVSPFDTPPLKPGSSQPLIGSVTHLPETSIISHAPGWTLFRNIYMANGTLFILSSAPHDFPEIRMMTSTPLEAFATPENIAAREPTKHSMDIITPEEARRYWGGDVKRGQRNRVWSVQGNTILFNDPGQFLNHYYHFVGELLLGTVAFWQGGFSPKKLIFRPHKSPGAPGFNPCNHSSTPTNRYPDPN